MSIVPTGGIGAAPTDQMRELVANEDDLRKMSESVEHSGVRQRLWGFEARLDPNVTLEEYMYWAKVEREMEAEEHRQLRANPAYRGLLGSFKGYFAKNPNLLNEGAAHEARIDVANAERNSTPVGKEKTVPAVAADGAVSPIAPSHIHEYDAEWRQASRALRTAGWGSIFYLITTDILGWGQTPYVFASAGYGLAAGVFVLFGIAAGCSGYFIWQTFLALDSSRFPMLTFGDPFFRLFGPKTRHFINITQAFQMFCSVAVVLLGNTQVLSQLANAKVCYVAVAIIVMVVGIISGSIRSLRNLGWLCNGCVWINIVSFIILCVAAAKFGPDPTVALQTTLLKNQDPVTTFIGTPPAEFQQQTTDLFAAQFNGIDTIVYAFSGALLFIAFLAEMRHPMDFWKGMLLAQVFITVVYVFFGAFMYTYYGQYAITSITQVSSPYGIQVVSNVLALLTGFLAVFLYFNVGFKTVYLELGQELMGLPAITTRKGRWMWFALGPFYWILALVFAMSVPNFTGITNLIGGLLSLNFTYSIPAIMFFAFKIQTAAALPGEGFDPVTGQTTRHDGGLKRLVRGFVKSWYISGPVAIFAMGGLASSGMGSWSAIVGLEQIFGPGGTILTSWSCTALG